MIFPSALVCTAHFEKLWSKLSKKSAKVQMIMIDQPWLSKNKINHQACSVYLEASHSLSHYINLVSTLIIDRCENSFDQDSSFDVLWSMLTKGSTKIHTLNRSTLTKRKNDQDWSIMIKCDQPWAIIIAQMCFQCITEALEVIKLPTNLLLHLFA